MNAAPRRVRLGLLLPCLCPLRTLRMAARPVDIAKAITSSDWPGSSSTSDNDGRKKSKDKFKDSGNRPAVIKDYMMPQGHGENIWVFTHRRTEQVIFSFTKTLNGFHDLKQLPFNGKKTKPAKLRKDYWYPMATIRFPRGLGEVGRSVFQKLRELRHLHEVAWQPEFRLKSEAELTDEDRDKMAAEKAKGKIYRPIRSKEERGVALNAQKKNVIADMAVVLAGKGAGNKMVYENPAEAGRGGGDLVPVTVEWANDQDRAYAEAWSNNVTHGLFERPTYVSNLGSPIAHLQ